MNMMKRILLIALSIFALASCQKDPVKEQADWTIIFYGNGGHNLDGDMIGNLRALYQGMTLHSNVQAAIMFKLSADPDEDMLKSLTNKGFDFRPATTYRFCVDPALAISTQLQFTQENIYGSEGGNLDITDGKNLTEFISWAAKERPAKRYLLIVSDHGRGYHPQLDVYSAPIKSILVDDGHEKKSMPVCTMRNAIQKAGVPISCLYMDACFMNTIENIYELQPVADYIIAATGGMPDLGGDYKSLVNRLSSADSSIEEILSRFTDDTADNWNAHADQGLDPDEFMRCNIAVLHTPAASTAAPAIKTFMDDLIDAYSDPELRAGIDNVTANTPANDTEYPCCYDLYVYLQDLAAYVPSATQALDALDGILIHNRGNRYTESTRIPTINFLLGADGTFEQLHLEDDGEQISYVDRYHWDGSLTRVYYAGGIPGSEAPEGNWGGSGPATYEPIRLNQLTGWCRWLQINQQKPLYLYNLLKK